MILNKADENLRWAQDMLCLGRLVANKITMPELRKKALEICTSPPEMTLAEGIKKTVELQKWWDLYKIDEFVDWGIELKFEFSAIKSTYRSDNRLNLYNISGTKEFHSEIPPEIFQLHQLRSLSCFEINFSGFEKFPKFCENLPKLERLCLSKGSIMNIPYNILKLSHLNTLNLANNLIKFLPSTFTQLVNLKILLLESNKLKKIPQEIFKLTNLEVLKLNSNDIKHVSPQITALKNLRQLEIANNQIREIKILQELQLEELYAEENPIRWDLNFLKHAHESSLEIIDIESERCLLREHIANNTYISLIDFYFVLNQINKTSKEINENKKFNISLILMLLLKYFNFENSILSNRYEELGELIENDFHKIVQYVFEFNNLNNIRIILDILVSALEIDNNFLRKMSLKTIYSIFSHLFKTFKDCEDIIESALICLSHIENSHCYMEKNCEEGLQPHPLSLIGKMAINRNMLISLASILISINTKNKGKINHSEFQQAISNIKTYFFLQNEISMADNYITRILIEKKILKESRTIRIEPKITEMITTELLLYGELDLNFIKTTELCIEESLEYFSINAYLSEKWQPIIFNESIKNIISFILEKSNHDFYQIELFNFMYRRCYTNTIFIANLDSPFSSAILHYFCTALNKPSKIKKSLEAIALLTHANDKVVVLNEWIKINRTTAEFIQSLITKIPDHGEKLAWCGALKLQEHSPTIPFSFNDSELLTMKMDPLLNYFITDWEKKGDEFEKKLKNQRSLKVTQKIHEIKKFKFKSEKTLSDYVEKKIRSLQSECEKIKFIFKNAPNMHLYFLHADLNKIFSNDKVLNSSKLKKDGWIAGSIEALNQLKTQKASSSEGFQAAMDQTHAVFDKILKENQVVFLQMDLIENSVKEKYYIESTEFYNRHYILPIQQANGALQSKINQCKSIFDKLTSEFQQNALAITPENFKHLVQNGIPLSNQEPLEYSIHMNQKIKKNILEFTTENLQIKENTKNRHLKEKIKKLKEENKGLRAKTSLLEEKMQSSERLAKEKKEMEEERNDLQIAHLIQLDIENLMFFQALPPKSHWSQAQQKGWTSIMHHLKEIETMTQPSSKQFRNWERKEAWRLLELVGFQAKGELDGSHLEIYHPLFNIHESVSFNTQRQTAIRLMKSYFESIHEVLELWYHEITKKKQVPFGQ